MLLALARRAREFKRTLPPEGWVDRESGVVVERLETPELRSTPSVWDSDALLVPGGPVGTGAKLEARVGPVDLQELAESTVDVTARFGLWLVEERGLKERDAARALEHVGGLIRAMISRLTPIRAIHEYDLRDYLSAYAVDVGRKGVGGVLDGLRSFFEYLAAKREIECPWAETILADRASFEGFAFGLSRIMPKGKVKNRRAVMLYLGAVINYMQDRGLVPGFELSGGREWLDEPGFLEGMTKQEHDARWLVWREELIAAGVTSPNELREQLKARSTEWLATPGSDGRSPLEELLGERVGRGEEPTSDQESVEHR